jgi:hypothetical protein
MALQFKIKFDKKGLLRCMTSFRTPGMSNALNSRVRDALTLKINKCLNEIEDRIE